MATKKALKTEEESKSELLEALRMVSDEKNIPVEALVESIETSLASAYKKAFGGTGDIRVSADLETNDFRVFAQKRVVQTVLNPNIEIAWRAARDANPGLNLGDAVEEEVTPSGFGRIAAQTAKQVLMQKLREAERAQVVSEYADKSGEMFRANVQREERGNIIVSIGKAEAILPRREQVQGESYRFGDAIYVFVVEVRQNMRGPSITVSRTHPGLVRQLFTLEVPEIADGIVELKNVAREAGQRTKIAVAANNPDVDPVGACVGPRGNRVGKVVDELGNEKVDIVRWNADPIEFLTNALSPAQVAKVILTEEAAPSRENAGTATVIVAEDQQSLAIGKQGQNVRLAAKLTGWKIDIRTEKQYAEEQAKKMLNPDFAPPQNVTQRESVDEHAELFAIETEAEPAGNADVPFAPDNAHEAEAVALLGGDLSAAQVTMDDAQHALEEAKEASDGLKAEEEIGGSAPLSDVETLGDEIEVPGDSYEIGVPGDAPEAPLSVNDNDALVV